MNESIRRFIDKFEKIMNEGWIKTMRSGTTGIGKTLEEKLGIVENNLQEPDFEGYELKSMRNNNNSMLTLITKAPDEPRAANTKLRLEFGYASEAYDNDSQVLHTTLDATRYTNITANNRQLKINVTDEEIQIIDENNIVWATWHVDKLVKRLNKKINEIIFVKADSRGTGKNEEFYYNEAYLLHEFDTSEFLNQIKLGNIKIDLRIGQYHSGKNKGKTHDHGTGFRIFEKDFPFLFKRERLV